MSDVFGYSWAQSQILKKSGIAMYALSSYLDSCHFMTVPVTADGITDVYVVSCPYSMLRVMNQENL